MYFINHIITPEQGLHWLVALAVTSSIKQREICVSYVKIPVC